MISSSQRPLPDNTQHSQQTNIHAPGGIRTHDLSRRAAADLRLRPRGHWDLQGNIIDFVEHDFPCKYDTIEQHQPRPGKDKLVQRTGFECQHPKGSASHRLSDPPSANTFCGWMQSGQEPQYDNPSLSSTKVKNAWSYTSTPTYTFTARCLNNGTTLPV